MCAVAELEDELGVWRHFGISALGVGIVWLPSLAIIRPTPEWRASICGSSLCADIIMALLFIGAVIFIMHLHFHSHGFIASALSSDAIRRQGSKPHTNVRIKDASPQHTFYILATLCQPQRSDLCTHLPASIHRQDQLLDSSGCGAVEVF